MKVRVDIRVARESLEKQKIAEDFPEKLSINQPDTKPSSRQI